ncbi:MAG: precorrin-8X methylmutase [Rhodospirillaceae bacterium]|nr:precorrin-8X methylmutase [Rhodospirillaceae bacterium]MDD9914261.1 precorrin-8X methylmutase [Rhodospirillaceae bacterium]MDD9925530.1 precorrin-8X methylmutase [Rhodospirillaceae bacterium]
MSKPAYSYIRDPAEIYRQSFAAIRRETDLSRLDEDLTPVALRLVHACAMPEIVDDLAASPDAARAGRDALAGGAPILTDVEMVARGVIANRLPQKNDVICRLGDPSIPNLAASQKTTRSAAAVTLWPDQLAGAVVAIGNAPTALFRLLEGLAEGWPTPALILGFPVGFIGAAESKEALIEGAHGAPYITLRGRRGGSALAAAAVNALVDVSE